MRAWKALLVGGCLIASTLAITLTAASAVTPLTKAQYIAKLRAANAASSKADDAAIAALQSKTTTAAQVKARFFAMGKAHLRVGKSFESIVPPNAATKANRDFAHAEIVFGQQNEAIAQKLPATKAAIVKYLQSLKQPSGGTLLDHAIAELHKAGFKI